MTGRFRIRHLATTAALLALTAAGVVAVQTPASADTPEVALTLSPTTVTAGGTITVTETITNINGFTILGPTARLFSSPSTLTDYTTLVGCDAGAGGSCATVTDGSGNPTGYEGVLGQALGGYQSATVSFTIAVNASAPSSVETLEGQLFGRNYATDPVNGPTLTVNGLADLGVTLTGPPTGLLNLTLNFTVKVTNNGPGPETSSTYTASLPSGLTAKPTPTCAGQGGTVCTIGPLGIGASTTATLSVPVGLLSIGIPYTFGVTHTTSDPRDPNPANDSASTTCTVVSVLLVSCR